MTNPLQRIRAASAQARLRFLKLLNRFAALLFAAIVAVSQFYPQGIISAGINLPKWAIMPAAVAWLMLVEYASAQPKNPA